MHVHQQAKRLQMLREKHDLSCRKLGKIVGVSGSMVARWCNGKAYPSRKHTATICKYFNIQPSWFIYGVGGSVSINGINNVYNSLSVENKQAVMEFATALSKAQNQDQNGGENG